MDFPTPLDEIHGLQWNGGMANGTAELVNTNKENSRSMTWVAVEKEPLILCIPR